MTAAATPPRPLAARTHPPDENDHTRRGPIAMADPLTSFDPRTGAGVEDVCPESTASDVDQAVRRAERAAPGLEELGGRGRALLLDALADALEAERAGLVALADRETALGLPRLNGELTRTTYQLRFLGATLLNGGYRDAVIDHARDSPMGPLPDLRRMLVPLGPVAVFAASNFPFAFSVPGGDVASALAAGCPVVVKAHPSHPATSEAVYTVLTEAAARTGAPVGVLERVHGVEAGGHLVTHPGIKAVAFTGSARGGRALFDLATSRPDPIPFFGELGSLNPLVVTPAAAAERGRQVGEGWVASFTLGTGQFCTKPGLALVPTGPAGDALRDSAVGRVRSLGASWMLNAAIRDACASGARRLEQVPGAIVHTAGGAADGEGFAALPKLVEVGAADLVTHASPLLEECFGPVSVLARYGSEDDLLETLRHVEGSLTVSLHIADGETALPRRLLRIAAEKAGRVVVNAFPTGVAVNWAMQHGGPWPAATSSQHTSVGAASLQRFLRPVAYQDVPDALLPAELREGNPLTVRRCVDGEYPAGS